MKVKSDHRSKFSNLSNWIAQLVEHRTGITEVTGSNPVEALIFFRLPLSNCLNSRIYCDDHFSLSIIIFVVTLSLEMCVENVSIINYFCYYTIIIRQPKWRTKEVLQHGRDCIILHKNFDNLSQLWDNTHTLNLENCLLYLSSIVPQFLNFIH